MNIQEISQIQSCADGQIITSITGTLTKIYPPKATAKSTVQNGVLTDSTGNVKVTFWGSDCQSLKGKTITLKSVAKKRGLVGLTVKYSDYDKANTLSVSDEALIPRDNEVAQGSAPSVAPSSKPPLPVTTSSISKADAIKQIKAKGGLYAACYAVAQSTEQAIGEDLPEPHFQALVSSLFISADRSGLGAAFIEKDEVKETKPESKPVEKDEDDIGW